MSRRERLLQLQQSSGVVFSSMLRCDFGDLAREVEALRKAGIDGLHLDVMDGHFVPNLTYGLTLVETFRQRTDLPLDVHLMISNPQEYVRRYREAGADAITVHLEAVEQVTPVLRQIRDLGALAGLAINPGTPTESAEPYLEECDFLLVMTVEPGFGGQDFNPQGLDKLRTLRDCIAPEFVLQVDGGINGETIAACAAAGANWFVVGSAIFEAEDYAQRVQELKTQATSG